MRRFVIHCPDNESIEDARDFFAKLFGNAVLKNTKTQIETKYGVIVMFTKNAAMETHGCKLEDFLVLGNKIDDASYSILKMCTLG
jgi:hypothetical protein